MQKWTSIGLILGTLVLSGCSDVKTPSAQSATRHSEPDTPPDGLIRTQPGSQVPVINASLELSPDARGRMTPSATTPFEFGGNPAASDTGNLDAVPGNPGEEIPGSDNAAALLEIGDPAPEISVVRWFGAEPDGVFHPGSVHVIEFWETACPPCLDSIRHTASLQTEYRGHVTFIGITPEQEITVAGFLEKNSGIGHQKWSEIVSYPVGIDDGGQTRKAYMEASRQDGIPCAFVIGRSGRIEWIGDSQDLDGPLQEIVAGSWDSAAARKLAAQTRRAKKARRELGPDIWEAVNSGEYALAAELVEQLLQHSPNDADLLMFRLQCLLRGGLPTEANAAAGKLITAAHENAARLDQVAWMMATASESSGIDLNLALAAARRAAELTREKDASVFETMARIQFRNGNLEDAIAFQKKAIDLVSTEAQRETLKSVLDEYENALKNTR